jgi:hypothetical protein
MQSPLTEHARIRMQQRGIPRAALDITYAVVGPDDAIVTVGHRHRRFEHV